MNRAAMSARYVLGAIVIFITACCSVVVGGLAAVIGVMLGLPMKPTFIAATAISACFYAAVCVTVIVRLRQAGREDEEMARSLGDRGREQ